MTERDVPQHKVVIQNLYSSKANWDKALRHGYTIAQARSDVFFSLLFGGQVCFSAGAFFDSPIAVRIFGELCSHPKFGDFCEDYGWRPLWLNTDRRPDPNSDKRRELSPEDFVTSRWRNIEMSFTFFRESEPGFDDRDKMRVIKDKASDALTQGNFGSLTDILEPLFEDHDIAFKRPAEGAEGEVGSGIDDTLKTWFVRDSGSLAAPAILTADLKTWYRGLMAYISKYKMLSDRSSTERPNELDKFFPMLAVLKRTRMIDGISRMYSKDELTELNSQFMQKIGNPATMNPIHISAPTHYQHYYPLIDYWMETEWHQVRHRMYGAKTTVLSSDWQMRDIFDFDQTSMATYLKDVRVDGSLRVAQEGFGEINWDVLFATITDRKWRRLIKQMRAETDLLQRRRFADGILNLLASKFSEFQFENDHGFVSINLKQISKLGCLAAYAGCVVNYHSTLEGLFGMPLALATEIAAPVLAIQSQVKAAAPLLRPLLKGATYLFAPYKARQLRRAIVPDIYGA